jgi:hypothetical protein
VTRAVIYHDIDCARERTSRPYLWVVVVGGASFGA